MTRSTLVFHMKPRRVYLGLGLCAIMVASGVAVLLTSPPNSVSARFWAGAWIVMGGVLLVLGIREVRYKRYLALLREGIYARSATSRSLVRWETIERLGFAQIGFQPLSGWDLTYPLPNIAGGDALPGLIAGYARDPEARRQLG